MMENMPKIVRSVLALVIIVPISYLAITGTLKPSEYLPIAAMVIGYYFGEQPEGKKT